MSICLHGLPSLYVVMFYSMSKCINSLQAQMTPGVTLKAHPNTAWFDVKHHLYPQPQTLDSETSTVSVPASATAPAPVPAPTVANPYLEVLAMSIINLQQMMQMNLHGGHLS